MAPRTSPVYPVHEPNAFENRKRSFPEPQKVVVSKDEEIVTMSIRGSLAPQRGEGLRVRGEIAPVTENQHRISGSWKSVRGGRPTSLFSAFSLSSVSVAKEDAVKSLFPDIWMQRHVAASPRELRSGRSAPSPLRGERAGVRGGGSANLFSAFSSVKSGLFAPPLRVNPLPATRGFTLIEIMMVVAIMGLVAATGLPSIIANLKKEGMRKAVSDVETICRNARQNAILTGKRTSITFYPAEKKLQLDGGAGTYETSSATLPDNVEIAMLDINLEDYGASPWAKVFFNPNGTSDELTLVLLSGGEYKKISLEFSTSLTFVTDVNQ